MRFDADRGVQTETVDVGTELLACHSLARQRAPERQHLLPSAGAKGDAVSDGRRLQWPRAVRACLTVGIRLGQVGLPHVLDQHTPASEHLHEPGDDGLQQRVQRVVGGRTRLDEAGRAAVAYVGLEPGSVQQMAREHALHHLQHRRDQLRLRGQQHAQRDRQRQHPLAHRHMRR